MYERFYGLREAPFSLTPDTSFFYDYPDHQEALNVLLVALRMGEGFLKITGEVGTGKTLICRKLLRELAADEGIVTAYIPNPHLQATALCHALAEELGLPARHIGQHRLLGAINQKLVELRAAGRQVVLLIDEAQVMPLETLESLRLLTNLETEKSKLLQVVLFGQPELDRRLDLPNVRQLRQRIAFSYRLLPMQRRAVMDYLAHRLRVAGYEGEALFTPAMARRMHKAARGIPRLINILAHKTLLAAFGEGETLPDGRHLRRAVADTEDVHRGRQRLRALGYVLLGLSASSAAGLLLAAGAAL